MKNLAKIISISTMLVLLSVVFMEASAHARAGGGRSFGSRGTRSYSMPASPSTQPSPYRSAPATSPNYQTPYQQPAGGFLRGMAGGIMGGMLGGMLFRSLGFGGMGGMGGGIGLFEILLLAGIGYMIYKFVKKNRDTAPAQYGQTGYQGGTVTQMSSYQGMEPAANDVESGLSHIRQMDPSFDEQRFNDSVMDMFFKIQGAWMNRNLSTVTGILTEEMRGIFQEDIDRLLRDRQVNRLENIAVRKVDIIEVWQESGQDYITASIYANLLDYTTDDATGAVVSGSKTDPVKFEEYWTFIRPVGNNQWRLSAINQK